VLTGAFAGSLGLATGVLRLSHASWDAIRPGERPRGVSFQSERSIARAEVLPGPLLLPSVAHFPLRPVAPPALMQTPVTPVMLATQRGFVRTM